MKIKIRCLLVLLGLVIMIGSCSQRPKPKPVSKTVKPKAAVIQDPVKKVMIVEPNLKKLVDELNLRLNLYDSIEAMHDYTKADLTMFKLSAADRDSIIAQSDENNIPGWILSSTYQDIIDDLLRAVLNHPAIKKYQLGDILHIDVVTSDDRRVFNIVLPENTGGTYKSNLSWMQYRADDGKIYNYYPEHLLPENDSINKAPFNIDGFSTITAIRGKRGTKYVFQGGVAGCTTCIEQYIESGHFDKGKAILDFSFSIRSRYSEDDDDKGIIYDVKTKTIRVDHTPSDLDEGICSCNPGAEEDENGETIQPDSSINNIPIRHGKKLICVFKFNGSDFVLNRRQSRQPY